MTNNVDYHMKVFNTILDLVWKMNRSSYGLSNSESNELRDLFEATTPKGRTILREWAKDNSFSLPEYFNN